MTLLLQDFDNGVPDLFRVKIKIFGMDVGDNFFN
jgi:hypothetical protein